MHYDFFLRTEFPDDMSMGIERKFIKGMSSCFFQRGPMGFQQKNVKIQFKIENFFVFEIQIVLFFFLSLSNEKIIANPNCVLDHETKLECETKYFCVGHCADEKNSIQLDSIRISIVLRLFAWTETGEKTFDYSVRPLDWCKIFYFFKILRFRVANYCRGLLQGITVGD